MLLTMRDLGNERAMAKWNRFWCRYHCALQPGLRDVQRLCVSILGCQPDHVGERRP